MMTYGVGIIGLGVMGRTMAAAMEAHPRFRVVGAYDPALIPQTTMRAFASAEALVRDPAVACVYVASPPALHLAGVQLAAAAGKPILCEKPLAATIEEAESCLETVEEAGIPSAVNFYFAASDAAIRLRRLVLAGALGRVRSAQLTLRFKRWPRPWQSAAGSWLALPEAGGFTREVVSHFLFLAHRMFGAGHCVKVAMERGPAGTETKLQAAIGYPGVTLEIDGAVGGALDDHNRLTISGANGSASLVDWETLDYRGADAGAPLPDTSMLDSLAAMLDGELHELASLSEAVSVVALTESLIGYDRNPAR